MGCCWLGLSACHHRWVSFMQAALADGSFSQWVEGHIAFLACVYWWSSQGRRLGCVSSWDCLGHLRIRFMMAVIVTQAFLTESPLNWCRIYRISGKDKPFWAGKGWKKRAMLWRTPRCWDTAKSGINRTCFHPSACWLAGKISWVSFLYSSILALL